VGRQGLSRTRRGVPRWPAAVAILSIGASYIALSEYVTFGPRLWLPGLVSVLVVPLLLALGDRRRRAGRAHDGRLRQRGLPVPSAIAQQDGNKGAIGWAPGFLDYLFLAFNTSAAFSPTHTPVLSRRAKILMVGQSVLPLVVLFVLVGWAVNALKGLSFSRRSR
jgi:hypothetical protein